MLALKSLTVSKWLASLGVRPGTYREKALLYIFKKGDAGATSNEFELNVRGLRGCSTASATFRHLYLDDMIQKSGERRHTTSGCLAEVYVIDPVIRELIALGRSARKGRV